MLKKCWVSEQVGKACKMKAWKEINIEREIMYTPRMTQI